MFKRRKGKAQKHLSGGTQKGSSCGEEGRFGHNTGSNFPDSTGEVRDGEVSGVSDGAISDVSGSDFSLTGANERTGGGASISCRDFSVGGKDISGGNFSFDVANECAGVADISDGLVADISDDLGFDGSAQAVRAAGVSGVFAGVISDVKTENCSGGFSADDGFSDCNISDSNIAEVFGDTNNSFAYNLKEHKKREEKGEAAANSSAKSSRIIGKIYKPRRMVAAVLAAAMFLFAFPLNSLAQTIKDTNAAEGSLNNGGKSETVSITGKPENRIVAEAADRRSESTKQFLMDDGSYLLVEYPMNVHYRGSDGEWVDYNNTMNTTVISEEEYERQKREDSTDGFEELDAMCSSGALNDAMSGENVGRSDSLEKGAAASGGGGEYSSGENGTMSNLSADSAGESPDGAGQSIDLSSGEGAENIVGGNSEGAANGASDGVSDGTSGSASGGVSAGNISGEIPIGAELLEERTVYTPTANAREIELSKKPKKNRTVSIKDGDKEIVWGFDSVNSGSRAAVVSETGEASTGNDAFLVLNNLVKQTVYEDAFEGVDLQYFVMPGSVKENIVLKNSSAKRSFTVNYRAKGLDFVQADERTVNLVNSAGEVEYVLSAPYMSDAAGNECAGVTMTVLAEKNGKAKIEIAAIDKEWLDSEERVYPVTVDPLVELDRNFSWRRDCYVRSDNIVNTNCQHIYIGNDDTSNSVKSRALFKIDINENATTGGLGKGDEIICAAMQLISCNTSSAGAVGEGTMQIDAYMITESWGMTDSADKLFNIGRDPAILDYVTSVCSEEEEEEEEKEKVECWDITKAVRLWQRGVANNGIMLKATDESHNCRRYFGYKYSGKYDGVRPLISIQYINTTGYNDYNSYKTYEFGASGTLGINEYTGMVTYGVNDISYSGNHISAAISHVYNVNSENDYTYCGDNWQLNISQRIIPVDDGRLNAAKVYLKYIDADGTVIYFKRDDNDTNKHTDELGIGLTVTGNSTSGYSLKDKAGSTSSFDRDGKLTAITDSEGNYINIVYDPSSRPISVTESGGTNRRSVLLSYNSSGLLSKVTDAAGRAVTYTYTNNRLSGITRYDGCNTAFTYHGAYPKLLASVSSGSNTIYIDYDGPSGKFSRLKEENATALIGLFTDDKTVFIHKGKDNSVSASSRLLEHCIFNRFGQKVSSYVTDSTGTMNAYEGISDLNFSKVYGAASSVYSPNTDVAVDSNNVLRYTAAKNPNKLLSSHTVSQSKNTVRDGSFENSTGWSTNSNVSILTDTVNSYFGHHILRIAADSTTTADRSRGGSNILKAGETYTLSGYIKTYNLTGKGARISLKNDNETTVYAATDYCKTVDWTHDNGWQRFSVTFKSDNLSTAFVICEVADDSDGYAYFDGIMLEESETLNSFNLVSDGECGDTSGAWTVQTNNLSSADGIVASAGITGKGIKLTGETDKQKFVHQTVKVPSLDSKATYILSGWAKADSAKKIIDNDSVDSDYKYFGFKAFAKYSDGHTEWFDSEVPRLESYSSQWQYHSFVLPLSKYSGTPTEIGIYCCYYNNVNTAYFDDIQLVRDKAQSYTYDEAGNCNSVTDITDNKTSYTYSPDNELLNACGIRGERYHNTYSPSKKHRLLNEASALSTTKYSYDSKGNVTNATTYSAEPEDGNIYYIYSASRNYVLSVETPARLRDNTSDYRCKLVKHTVSGTDYYSIHPVNNSSLALTAGSTSNGATLSASAYSGSGLATQHFKFVKNETNGDYYIIPRSNLQKTIDYAYTENSDGSLVNPNFVIWSRNDSDKTQRFVLAVDSANSSSTLKTETTATYTDSGQYLKSATNSYGKTTRYEYDEEEDRLLSVISPRGNITRYDEYMTGTTTNAVITETYLDTNKDGDWLPYVEPRIKTSSTGGRLNYIQSPNVKYKFYYNDYGRVDSVGIDTNINYFSALAEYTYGENNGPLARLDYGNSDYTTYYYDTLGRLKSSVKHNSAARPYKKTAKTEFFYDSVGNVASRKFILQDLYTITDSYSYDSLGRLISSRISNGLSAFYNYDSYNRLTRTMHTLGDTQHIQTYAYSPEGYVKSVSLSGGKNLTTERDNLGRVKSKTVSTTTPVTDSYTYKSSSKSGYTTGLVHRHTNALGSYIYTYDSDGNITEIESSDGTLLYTYEYDELGQLTEECSRPEQKCTAYTYDLNGNIKTKTEYPVDITIKEYIFKNVNPSRTYTYSYNNDLWKDELTSYTRVIHDSSGDRTYTTPANTYDAIGNPTKYFGSDLEWDYGRQLRRFYSGIYDTTYSYNADGMLIKQAVTYNTIPDYPINYSYENFYDGTMLIRRTGQGFDAWFDYDESGSPVGMNVTTTTGSSSNPTVTTTQYYFVKNLQGDIVAIADATGEIQYTYTYDSWGKVLSTKGQGNSSPSVLDASCPANINPFRYRGYYYDGINEIYWLQSRFYDPNTGRFLNADGYVSTGQGILSTNMFLYCGNNPVNRLDSNGEFFLTATAFGIIGLTLLLFAGTAIILEETAKNPPLIPPISPPCLDIKLKIKENTLDLPKLDEKEKDITAPPPPSSGTKIYRYGGTNPSNLTPKEKDKFSGLSFSTIPKPGAAVTTIEELNATGVVYAVRDNALHVSVRPIGGTMDDWINAGSSSVWTQAVKSVVVKWDGVN